MSAGEDVFHILYLHTLEASHVLLCSFGKQPNVRVHFGWESLKWCNRCSTRGQKWNKLSYELYRSLLVLLGVLELTWTATKRDKYLTHFMCRLWQCELLLDITAKADNTTWGHLRCKTARVLCLQPVSSAFKRKMEQSTLPHLGFSM